MTKKKKKKNKNAIQRDLILFAFTAFLLTRNISKHLCDVGSSNRGSLLSFSYLLHFSALQMTEKLFMSLRGSPGLVVKGGDT